MQRTTLSMRHHGKTGLYHCPVGMIKLEYFHHRDTEDTEFLRFSLCSPCYGHCLPMLRLWCIHSENDKGLTGR